MNRRTTFKTVTFIRWHSFTDTFLHSGLKNCLPTGGQSSVIGNTSRKK